MTPTTKAALDAAENLLRRFRNYIVELSEPRIDLAANALRLIAEARKAEESDTARLDWLINSSNHAENGWLSDEAWDAASENCDADSDDVLSYIRSAIDAAMESAKPEDR